MAAQQTKRVYKEYIPGGGEGHRSQYANATVTTRKYSRSESGLARSCVGFRREPKVTRTRSSSFVHSVNTTKSESHCKKKNESLSPYTSLLHTHSIYMANNIALNPMNHTEDTKNENVEYVPTSIFRSACRQLQEIDNKEEPDSKVNPRDKIGPLRSWEVNLEKYSTNDLTALASTLFKNIGVQCFLGISMERLRHFCFTVERNYNNNPYHNFRHGFSVMHVTFLILTSLENLQKCYQFDILHKSALLISALCHDIRHTGRNSTFHLNMNSTIAEKFKEKGPIMECFHAETTLRIINETRIFDRLPVQDRKKMCKLISELILSTDMQQHHMLTESLDALSEEFNACAAENNRHANQSLLAKMIIHCADISNPAMEPSISRSWAKSVLREFTEQVTEEGEKGIPVSNFMKASPGTVEEAKMHQSFIKSFASPAWQALVKALPSDELKNYCLRNIDKNLDYWTTQANNLSTTRNTRSDTLEKIKEETITKEGSLVELSTAVEKNLSDPPAPILQNCTSATETI